METGDNFESEYMMKNSLHLLLSEARAGRVYEAVVNFKPIGSKSGKTNFIEFKKLTLFLNLWSALEAFYELILPNLEIPLIWNYSYKISKSHEVNDQIDWSRSLEHQAQGKSGFVVLKKEKHKSEIHEHVIRFILGEILIHKSIIFHEFDFYFKKLKHNVYNQIKDDIEKNCRLINRKLFEAKDFGNFSDNEAMKNIENEFNELLIDENIYGSLTFSKYNKKIKIKRPKGFFINDAILSLQLWREQYLECRISLSEEIGLRLNQVSHKNRLFEFYCFTQFAEAFSRLGIGETVQRSFISSNRTKPEFKIGQSHYVYFDNRNRNFENADVEEVFISRFERISIPALKSTYVEWFIRNMRNYKDSIVIDAKYGGWSSREALKVIGYMSSYGVNNGIIIFKKSIQFQKIGGKLIRPGLMKLSLPSSQNKQLWIVTLIPNAEFEIDNELIMNELVSNVFKRNSGK